MQVHWRRWTGPVAALCFLGFGGLLIALWLDPAFWASGGADLRLLMLVMVFLLIANLCLRRALAVWLRRPAIAVEPKGLRLSDGLAERLLPWGDIERIRLTRSRLAIDLRNTAEGRGAWLFMAQLGVAPPLRYLYAAISMDPRAFVAAVRGAAGEYLRIDMTS